MNLSLEKMKKFSSEIAALKTRHEKAIHKANDIIDQARGAMEHRPRTLAASPSRARSMRGNL
ncbi:MAG TPA: hypothetical protein VFH68_07585 [Polyangia bacterium]|nr:hypothetical protein [Polyangia bacterium]